MLKILALIAVVTTGALGIAACGDDDEEGTTAAQETGASVSFVSPADGDTVSGPVTAEVELTDFTLNADEVGMASVEGEGHLHFSMDGGEYDTPKYSGANGELAVDLGVDGQYSPAVEPTITYKGLPPGEHTLEVDLVNNDHSETGTSESVRFRVE
jgi:hypothetical protein